MCIWESQSGSVSHWIAADEALEALLFYEFDTVLLYHGSSVTDDAHEKLEQFINFRGKPERTLQTF